MSFPHRGLEATPTRYQSAHLDALRRDTLGDHKEARLGAPSDQHLSRGLAEAVSDALDLRRVEDTGFARDVVAEGRVGRDLDSLLLAYTLAFTPTGTPQPQSKGERTECKQLGLD